MEKALNVAKELYELYYKTFGKKMDEMKMHKLMYFADRESLMYTGTLLFEESFEGWKYGPVLKSVRSAYLDENSFTEDEETVSPQSRELLKNVMDRYGGLSSWKLSRLSHQELSWLHARKGLQSGQNGNVKLMVDMMKMDAARELAARR